MWTCGWKSYFKIEWEHLAKGSRLKTYSFTLLSSESTKMTANRFLKLFTCKDKANRQGDNRKIVEAGKLVEEW